MIRISELKQKVKSLVEDITGLKAYFDLVPNNIKTGILITRQATEFTGRTVDGEAHIVHHGFEVFIFSFVNAETAETITSKLVNATDGKYSADFRLIMVNSITPTEYDPEVGFWGNVISLEFVER